MLELANHPEGKVTLLWRPEPETPAVRIAGPLAAGLGFLLLFTPMAGRSLSEVALLLPAQALLLLVGVRLLASILRRGRLASSLHVASGELEVRAGRGPLSARRAFGAVDADHLLLTGETVGETRLFRLAVITRAGPPVLLCGDEPDEESLARAGLLLSQGMGIPLVDRRYTAAGGRGEPGRVARLGGNRLVVYVWTYRDRLRPRSLLLALGLLAGASRGLPLLVPALAAGLLLPAAAVLLVGLGAAAHAFVAMMLRRVTIRSDAVRIERLLLGIHFTSRTVPLERLAAVLLTSRGPWVSVRLRGDDRRTLATLPFEEPAVAAWLRMEIEKAVHAAAKTGTILPAGGPAR